MKGQFFLSFFIFYFASIHLFPFDWHKAAASSCQSNKLMLSGIVRFLLDNDSAELHDTYSGDYLSTTTVNKNCTHRLALIGTLVPCIYVCYSHRTFFLFNSHLVLAFNETTKILLQPHHWFWPTKAELKWLKVHIIRRFWPLCWI